MLARLAHVVAHHRRKVIGAWIVLTLFGGFAAGQVSKRWYQSFSIPGKSAYEANQRTLKTFGTGVRPPDVVVFHAAGDVTKNTEIEAAMQRAAAAIPGARTSSYFTTHDAMYLSSDRHTTFEEVYPPGPSTFDAKSGAARVRAADPMTLAKGHDPCGGRPFTRCRRGEHMDQSPRALVLPRHGDLRNGAAAVGRVLGTGQAWTGWRTARF